MPRPYSTDLRECVVSARACSMCRFRALRDRPGDTSALHRSAPTGWVGFADCRVRRSFRPPGSRPPKGGAQSQVCHIDRFRTAVPKTQGLTAHLRTVQKARRDVSGLPEPRVWTPPATRDFSLSNFERRVKRFRVSGLLMRRIDGCRRPTWRCADWVHIALVRFEALRLPPGFPDPVPMTVCPCTVLGLSRVSGDADFRFDSSESRTPESLFFHFLIRSRGPDRRPSLRRTRGPCRIPSSSRRPRRPAPSCSPARPQPASAVSWSAARPAKDRRFRASTPIG